MQGSYEAVEMSDQAGPETIEVTVYLFNIREFQPQWFFSKCFLYKVNTHIIYVLCVRVTMLKQGMVALEIRLIAIAGLIVLSTLKWHHFSYKVIW